MRPTQRVQATAEDAARDHRMQSLARLGYAAKGIVYATIGLLALGLVTGRGGSTSSSRDALAHLARSPFGIALLWVTALGMLGLGAWKIAESLTNVDRDHRDAKRWVKRLFRWLTALIYGGLAVTAFRLATGGHERGDQTQSLTARAMAVPFGRVLVAAIGVGVFAYAVSQGVVAYRKKFARHLALDGLAARNAAWVTRVCQFGIVARAVVFALMGAFLVQAAVQYDPNEALGLGQTLGLLAREPYGAVLLGVVALGLCAYAAYAFLEARYRRLEPSGT